MRMASIKMNSNTASPPAHIDMKIGNPKGTVNPGSEGLCVVGGGEDDREALEDKDA